MVSPKTAATEGPCRQSAPAHRAPLMHQTFLRCRSQDRRWCPTPMSLRWLNTVSPFCSTFENCP
eukprot:195715-Prymnesium_polylepis.1